MTLPHQQPKVEAKIMQHGCAIEGALEAVVGNRRLLGAIDSDALVFEVYKPCERHAISHPDVGHLGA